MAALTRLVRVHVFQSEQILFLQTAQKIEATSWFVVSSASHLLLARSPDVENHVKFDVFTTTTTTAAASKRALQVHIDTSSHFEDLAIRRHLV